jgi:hypothetical protein
VQYSIEIVSCPVELKAASSFGQRYHNHDINLARAVPSRCVRMMVGTGGFIAPVTPEENAFAAREAVEEWKPSDFLLKKTEKSNKAEAAGRVQNAPTLARPVVKR